MISKRLFFLLLSLILVLNIYFLNTKLNKSQQTNEDIIKRFNQIYGTSNIHNKTRWMGIPAQQNPCDMWAIQEIINEIKPDFKTNNNFVSDRSREKFLLTFSPKGYLKRIK